VNLIYPARRHPDAHTPARESVDPWADVLGRSRVSLLADLATPRTTTELAERHGMSASTVSYHLSRLHRAGLVLRKRQGKHVLYRRTRLLASTPSGPEPARRTLLDADGVLSAA
jgi:DNA-binding transcriptional ArsR family regulator